MTYKREWAAGLCIGLAVGCTGGWILSTWPGLNIATSAKHWWDIVTAVGTVSIAAVSAWLTFTQLRTNARERGRKAAIAWARISPEIDGLRQTALFGTYAAQQRVKTGDGRKFGTWQTNTLRLLQEALKAPISNAIDDLALEDSDRGICLAEIMAQLPDVNQRLDILLAFGETQPTGGDIQAYVLLERLCRLGRSLDRFLEKRPSKQFDLGQYEALRVALNLSDPP